MTEEAVKKPKGKGGRPKGSRNKSILMKAQLKIDDCAEAAVEVLVALMENDKSRLNSDDDVPYSIRYQTAKTVLDKAVANEKDKDSPAGKSTNIIQQAPPKVFTKPRSVSN